MRPAASDKWLWWGEGDTSRGVRAQEMGLEGGAGLGTPEFSISQTTKNKNLGWESHTVIGSNRDICTNIKYHLLLSRFHKRKDSCHQKTQRRAVHDQDVPFEWIKLSEGLMPTALHSLPSEDSVWENDMRRA